MAYRASKVILIHISLFVLSTILTYGLAVGQGHIDAFIPYLGYLGDQPLESTVFTQFFVIVACTLAVTVQIHYVAVFVPLEKNRASADSLRANSVSLYVGYVAASSLFVLACFQESHTYYVHHIAEVLYLLSIITYCALHTFISLKEREARRGVRVFLSSFMVASFIVFLVSYIFAVSSYDKPWDERYHWSRNDGGWLAHIMSAAAQWLCIGLFHSYLLTCYSTMYKTLLSKTSIIVLQEDQEITN